MLLNKILHKNYILAQEFYQLKLPLDIESIIPNNDSVRLLHFAPFAKDTFVQMIEILHDLGEHIFIDGTKIESCANKYIFVWKKAVTKNLAKLLEKLAQFVADCESNYGRSNQV